jgi:hypothetical protein
MKLTNLLEMPALDDIQIELNHWFAEFGYEVENCNATANSLTMEFVSRILPKLVVVIIYYDDTGTFTIFDHNHLIMDTDALTKLAEPIIAKVVYNQLAVKLNVSSYDRLILRQQGESSFLVSSNLQHAIVAPYQERSSIIKIKYGEVVVSVPGYEAPWPRLSSLRDFLFDYARYGLIRGGKNAIEQTYANLAEMAKHYNR